MTSPRCALVQFLLVLLVFAPGCETTAFYRQAVSGQAEILRKSRRIEPMLADPRTSPKLRKQLAAVQEMRAFATRELDLPGGASYGKFADLGRESVVWSLVAAPEFSLKAKTWRYPLLGDLEYRGYFRKHQSEALATRLRAEGYDVHVGGVDAYSTLGWFHDPVLNTFVDYPDIDMAELIFHELTHRRLFRHGQTRFNEALATAVAETGVRRWLAFHQRDADLRHYETRLVRRREFFAHLEETRHDLDALYASDIPDAVKRQRKAAALADLQARFRELRRRWGGSGQSDWLDEPLNNAHLVSVIAYHKHVPTFHQLLDECGGDLPKFFARAKHLDLPGE
jgi:predicted aminopeptidase